MAPGDRLPTEPELMKRMGVSRITIRHALEQLKSEGLITASQGRGTFVAFPSVRPNLKGLSSFVEDISATGQSAQTEVLSLRLAKRGSEMHVRLGLPPSARLVCIEKIRLANADPISFETSYIPADIAGGWTRKLLESVPIFEVLAGQGVLVARADVEVGAAAAGGQVARRLRIKDGTALLQAERLIYDRDDRPIEFDILSYRSDRVRYSFHATSGPVHPALDARAGFKLLMASIRQSATSSEPGKSK